jgi:hypothetical protein
MLSDFYGGKKMDFVQISNISPVVLLNIKLDSKTKILVNFHV